MRQGPLIGALVLLSVSALLGATVFREDIAQAAQGVTAEIIGPLDSQANVRVHEQGTANVEVTNRLVPVHEVGTAPVNVANASVPVQQAGEPVLLRLTENEQYVVPAGKRLVIQYVNGPAGLALELLEPGGGLDNDEFFFFPGNPVSQLVSISVRSGLPLIALGAGGDPGSVVSGYLIDA